MDYSILLASLLASPQDAALPPFVEILLPSCQQLADLISAFQAAPVTPAATQAFETKLLQLLRQLGLTLCDAAFNHLEPQNREQMPPRLDYDGERYRCRDRSPNTIATLFGPVILRRYLYEDLEPGNPCLFPLEKQLGIVAGAATPALAERASWWLAQHSQGSTLDVLARDHSIRWSKDTLRQVTAAVAEGLEQQRLAVQINQVIKWLGVAYASKGKFRPSLVAGRDGIHLPMRGPKAYQEGAVATLSVYNKRGKRVGTVYLGRMPEPGQATLSEQLTALILGVLERWEGPLPRLAYITDMGSHPTSYFREVLSSMRHPRTKECLQWQRIGDYYHAASYVAQMAEALFGDKKPAASGCDG